jgi:hypothetical protein
MRTKSNSADAVPTPARRGIDLAFLPTYLIAHT